MASAHFPAPAGLPVLVAIGASAGGVEALSDLFSHLPAKLGAAFLVVLHVPPAKTSHLPEILGRTTGMPVVAAQPDQPLQAGHVYVAPANAHMVVRGARLQLEHGPPEGHVRPSIDVLLRSVAQVAGPRAIGVILSGALTDGTAGLMAIKQAHGVALVQDPAHAMHSSMPDSAIAHVAVDFAGSTSALAGEIARRVAAAPA